MRGMIELAWAGLLVVALGAVTATVLVPWAQLLEAGQSLMLSAAALGIPLEIIYFTLLWFLLGRGGQRPKGWQWRSFEHHHLLSRGEKAVVLPFFIAGALSFLGMTLGIGLVLIAFVGAARQM